MPMPPPHRIDIGADGGFVVPAEVLGSAFAMDPADVPVAMRAGLITSRLEQGHDSDEGTFRLTFYHRTQALRLIVDAQGHILKRTRFPVRPRPPSA